MEARGTKGQTALVESSLPYSRRQRRKRVGCGEEVSLAPEKIVRFLSSIKRVFVHSEKEAEQYNKPRKCVAKPSV